MMSKLLAFALFGAAAASNTTTNGTTTVTQGSSNNVVSGNLDGAANPTAVAGVATVQMTATIGLDIGSLTPATVATSDNTDSGACSSTVAVAPATVVTEYDVLRCDVAKGLVAALSTAEAVTATKVVIDSVAEARRRSLTATAARQLTVDSFIFTNEVTVGLGESGYLKHALEVSTDFDLGAALTTALPVSYGTITAASVSVANACEGTECAAVVAVTPPPTVSAGGDASTSDAIKTGLGLAAAVVSGLFLF